MTSEGDAQTEKKGNMIETSRSSLMNSQNLLESSRKIESDVSTF
jgi:hypothetical protein